MWEKALEAPKASGSHSVVTAATSATTVYEDRLSDPILPWAEQIGAFSQLRRLSKRSQRGSSLGMHGRRPAAANAYDCCVIAQQKQ